LQPIVAATQDMVSIRSRLIDFHLAVKGIGILASAL
jgi:hypothetical protein